MPESSQEARYRANLQGEVDGAHLYDTVGGRPALIVNHKATWEIK